jgi:hypothetical protein
MAFNAFCMYSALLDELLSWSEEQLQSQLPIEPGSHATVEVSVTGICDFISHDLMKGITGKHYHIFFLFCSFSAHYSIWTGVMRGPAFKSANALNRSTTVFLLE